MMILRVFPTYPKKKSGCSYCDKEGEKTVFRDKPAIVIIWKIGKFPVKKYYHPGCALEALQSFYEEWFTQSSPGHTKIGRPIKSLDPPRYRRLKALQRYHKKQGNEDRVEELEVEIQALEKTAQEKKTEPSLIQERRKETSSRVEEAIPPELAEVLEGWEGGEKAFPRPNERSYG